MFEAIQLIDVRREMKRPITMLTRLRQFGRAVVSPWGLTRGLPVRPGAQARGSKPTLPGRPAGACRLNCRP
jgi:hypothetical protein